MKAHSLTGVYLKHNQSKWPGNGPAIPMAHTHTHHNQSATVLLPTVNTTDHFSVCPELNASQHAHSDHQMLQTGLSSLQQLFLCSSSVSHCPSYKAENALSYGQIDPMTNPITFNTQSAYICIFNSEPMNRFSPIKSLKNIATNTQSYAHACMFFIWGAGTKQNSVPK